MKLQTTVNEDLDVPITTYSSYAVPVMPCSKTSEEYDIVQAKKYIQYSDVEKTIKMYQWRHMMDCI